MPLELCYGEKIILVNLKRSQNIEAEDLAVVLSMRIESITT